MRYLSTVSLAVFFAIGLFGCGGDSSKDIESPADVQASDLASCTPDESKCEADELLQCNTEGTDWVSVETCADGCAEGACLEPVCEPQCAGKECGPDGCDGSCGECVAPEQCTEDGLCVVDCEAACNGLECGVPAEGCDCGTCDDGDVCTDDACVEGACAFENNSAACDDENPCTESDACSEGACGGTAVNCDDENVCTTDVCLMEGTPGCSNTPVEDGTVCEEGWECLSGVCTCIPVCDGKVCGNDGCGGSCGECDPDHEECAKTASATWLCLEKQASVPAGAFWMGCNEAVDAECESDEYPYHEVYLDDYFIDVTEVTAGHYAACVDAGGCTAAKSGPVNATYLAEGKESHPINYVTWYHAEAYCAWAGRRLPTEAEWEKAARGTDGRKYPWGNEAATCDYALMDDIEKACGLNGTGPVCSKSPAGDSPYGLCDMAGSMWEWVADRYDAGYYDISPANNPQGPVDGTVPVTRGGSMANSAALVRTSNRNDGAPFEADSVGIGFRCARTVVNCDDGNICTDDSWVDGACSNTDNTAACDDGNPCTESDVCSQGACHGDFLPLEQLEELNCTCLVDSDCASVENGDVCDGTFQCTEEDIDGEATKVCSLDAETILACGDEIDCTVDSCDPVEGCQSIPDHESCDDANVCTDDVCVTEETPGCFNMPIEDGTPCMQGWECQGGVCTCVPDCGEFECGPVDGCGGSCGECLGAQDECVAGACVCQPNCDGKECGDSGCGGQCGVCAQGTTCLDFACVICGPSVTFSLSLEAAAQEVLLSGTFNDWGANAETAAVMVDPDEDGTWEATLELGPGTYQYKFIVDDVWMEDPNNPNKEPDGYGGFNSVIVVSACD